MSRETATDAIEELFDLLAPAGVPAVDGITLALDYDPGPAGVVALAEPVLLTVADAGLTATSFVIAVRIVFDTAVDAAAAQAAAREIVPAVDVLLAPHWGPGDWELGHSDELVAWVAECHLEVGREDGRFRPGLA